jgi:hypothetical protein
VTLNNQAESNEFKQRGGKRPGAGRKKGTIERITIAKQAIADRVFDYVQQKTGQSLVDLWFPLVTSEEPLVRIKALSYMTDRLEGKARETIVHEGNINHTLTDSDREAAKNVIQRLLPAKPAIEVDGEVIQ